MAKEWIEYNYGIFLRERDLSDVLEKAEHSNSDYFMQLNLQGDVLWLGFREPFESGIDRLHALYYKLRNRKGSIIYLCLGLWRNHPDKDTLYRALSLANAAPDGVLNSDDITEFMVRGESNFLVFRHPTQRPTRKDVPFYIEPR